MQLNRSTDYAIQMLLYLARRERPYPPQSWQQHRGITSLSASDQRETKGGRIYPGRLWFVWRTKIG